MDFDSMKRQHEVQVRRFKSPHAIYGKEAVMGQNDLVGRKTILFDLCRSLLLSRSICLIRSLMCTVSIDDKYS